LDELEIAAPAADDDPATILGAGMNAGESSVGGNRRFRTADSVTCGGVEGRHKSEPAGRNEP
jgi:hypothetical protein